MPEQRERELRPTPRAEQASCVKWQEIVEGKQRVGGNEKEEQPPPAPFEVISRDKAEVVSCPGEE